MSFGWWLRRPQHAPDVTVHGEAGGGKVLVTIGRDENGDPIEQAWIHPEQAPQWDPRFWEKNPSH